MSKGLTFARKCILVASPVKTSKEMIHALCTIDSKLRSEMRSCGNDNDNDTLRKVQPTSVSGLAGLNEGVMTPRLKSDQADGTCAVGKV